MPKNMIRDQYNDIAFIYDLLSDGDDGGIYFRIHAEKILNQLPKDARILDSACGTGNHAIWIAKQGFHVDASDISDDMIKVAEEKAKKEQQDIHFFRSSWEELPGKTRTQYDLVICPGNSFSHIERLDAIEKTFTAIRRVIKDGGTFAFDMRNWEKTFEEASLETQEFQVNSPGGPVAVRYSYDIKGWNTKCMMFVDVRHPEEKEYSQFAFDFFPLGYQQLYEALLSSGFAHIKKEYYTGEEFYFVTAI